MIFLLKWRQDYFFKTEDKDETSILCNSKRNSSMWYDFIKYIWLTRFPIEEAYITVYLDQWDAVDERWRQVNYYEAEFYAKDYPDGLSMPTVDITFTNQPRGCYYRLRGSFSVMYNGEYEGFSPVTDGILLD